MRKITRFAFAGKCGCLGASGFSGFASASPRFRVLLAEDGGVAAGFAFYFFTYSTWRGRPYFGMSFWWTL